MVQKLQNRKDLTGDLFSIYNYRYYDFKFQEDTCESRSRDSVFAEGNSNFQKKRRKNRRRGSKTGGDRRSSEYRDGYRSKRKNKYVRQRTIEKMMCKEDFLIRVWWF